MDQMTMRDLFISLMMAGDLSSTRTLHNRFLVSEATLYRYRYRYRYRDTTILQMKVLSIFRVRRAQRT